MKVAARAPNKGAIHAAIAEGEGAAIKKYDDRSLLNWGARDDGKIPRGRSPNLEGFNETFYISTGHKDKDSYKLNAFNQEESDKLASDRKIPDTRNYQ